MRAFVRTPFTGRARAELLFSVLAVPVGIGVPIGAAAFVLTIGWVAPGRGENASPAGMVAALLLLGLAIPAARRISAVHRRLAARLLGESVPAPSPFRAGRSVTGRLGARFGDGAGWRATAYLLLKLPVAMFEGYAVACWANGLINLTYPFWWGLYRNHPPNVRLSPVPIVTPLGHLSDVTTYPGTFLAFAVGVALILAAPGVTRAAITVDRRLMRALLGAGRLAQRLHDLERTRALAVEDSAALVRRIERDLHDGAQVRLAALAMTLGMAKEKLDGHGTVDLTQLHDLVGAAHKDAKQALIELRDLAKGIHPPVLDNGLADALATLATGSALPVELTTDIPQRPTPAIETIAYFCAAELLANAAKHSHAGMIGIRAAVRDGVLHLAVTDDGTGGADPARGSGLSGLLQRVGTVDGRLSIASPPGGPTQITVELPLRAPGR
jgi:signal transduction histidine kinase